MLFTELTSDNNSKSHRLKGGCYKWRGCACYLRTNLDQLMPLAERIQDIKNQLYKKDTF